MADKYRKAIVRYENDRQEVARLVKIRADMITSCEKESSGPPFDKEPKGDFCLRAAHKEMMEFPDGPYELSPGFLEVMEEGVEEGIYCKNCLDSYRIKIGPLADARQSFGVAKRSLSAMGKALIVEFIALGED